MRFKLFWIFLKMSFGCLFSNVPGSNKFLIQRCADIMGAIKEDTEKSSRKIKRKIQKARDISEEGLTETQRNFRKQMREDETKIKG